MLEPGALLLYSFRNYFEWEGVKRMNAQSTIQQLIGLRMGSALKGKKAGFSLQYHEQDYWAFPRLWCVGP